MASGPPILDAACVVVIDRTGNLPRLLLGRRRPEQVFLPDKWVFPGGRVEDCDREHGDGLAAFAAAAKRELLEESGLDLGAASAALYPLARAVTPPGHTRRFDTWFFWTNRADIVSELLTSDGELLDCGWFTIVEARALDLPYITRLILSDVENILNDKDKPQGACVPYYFQGATGYERSLIAPGCRAPAA